MLLNYTGRECSCFYRFPACLFISRVSQIIINLEILMLQKPHNIVNIYIKNLKFLAFVTRTFQNQNP